MSRNIQLIALCMILQGPLSLAQQATGNAGVCKAEEDVCVGRGKSIMQISSLYTKVPSQQTDIPGSARDKDGDLNIDEYNLARAIRLHDKAHCHVQVNASAVPLTVAGFDAVQQACCTPEMADFIKRYIESNNNEVCNMGSLNGFASQYDCPGDSGFTLLDPDLIKAKSGSCPWIKDSSAPACPVMQSSCAHYPQVPSPSTPSASPPSTPSTPSTGSQPVGPPAPAPTTSAPCSVVLSTTQATTITTTTTAPSPSCPSGQLDFLNSGGGFTSGYSDGTYGYLVPNLGYSGRVTRFALATFDSVQVLDLALVDPRLKGFVGGFADGTYGYVLPYNYGPNSNFNAAFSGSVARFALATFDAVQVLNLASVDPLLKGFYGGFADGTYGCVVPNNNGQSHSGKMARFALATFDSVQVLDLASVDPRLRGFAGGFADGTYGYVMPSHDGTSLSGRMARFALATFDAVQVLDLASIDPLLVGFKGGFADGTYGYLQPHANQQGYSGRMARFSLATFSGVQVLDLASTDPFLHGFEGVNGGFTDGTNAYMMTNAYPATGRMARFALATFADVHTINLAATDPLMKNFFSTFTDGTYGYAVPWGAQKIARLCLS